MAARPMPGASYMVSNMSSTSFLISGVILPTGSDTSRNRLSGRMMMSRSAMAGDVIRASGAVNLFTLRSRQPRESGRTPGMSAILSKTTPDTVILVLAGLAALVVILVGAVTALAVVVLRRPTQP